MQVNELLSEIGLTQRESKVYVALLELGLTTTGPLVKKSGVPNSKIYEILESLQNKGLVSWIIKSKTKYFQAANPNKIFSMFKEKEKRVKELIPFLESKQLLAKQKQSVEMFEGSKAIFAFLKDLIDDAKKGENYYSFSLGEEHNNKNIEIFYKQFGDKRYKKSLNVKILANKRLRKIFKNIYADRLQFFEKSIKFIDFDFPEGIIIFRDNIVMIDWSDNPTAIHIQSQKRAKQYINFVENMWKNN